MAFDIGSVVAHITADLSGFTEGIDSAKGQLAGLGDNLQNVGASIEDFATKASVISAVVFGAFTLVTKSAIEYAANLEQARVAYDAFTGSAEKGGHALQMVTEFARKTPFQLPEVVEAGQQLLGFGFKVDDLTQKLTEVGSLAIATHKPMSVAIDLFARAREGMFNLREFGQFGISREGLEQFGATFTKAGAAVDKSALLPALEKLIQSRFGDVLAKEALTMSGTISNIKDDMGRLGAAIVGMDPSTGTAIKGGLFEKLRDGVQVFYEWLDSHIGQIQTMAAGAFKQLETIFTSVLNAVKPIGIWIMANQSTVIEFLKGLAIGIGAILIIAPLVVVAMNPFILVFAAIALAIAALYMAWNSNFLGIRDVTAQIVNSVVSFFNNYLMPIIAQFRTWWNDHWVAIALILKGAWDIIAGIIQIAWALISGSFKITFDLMQGNWKKGWNDIVDMLKGAWNGIASILAGAIDFVAGWGGLMVDKLTKPFRDALGQISSIVDQIKNKLDFTQRHSPSIVDVVQTGVEKVNEALMGLAFNGSVSLAPNFGPGGTMPAMGISSSPINIYLDGAIIADSSSAMRMGELLGDSIIKKLQQNIRV